MEIEELTLESKGKDSIDEHGSFNFDILHEPCLHHATPKLAMLRVCLVRLCLLQKLMWVVGCEKVAMRKQLCQ
jgi:hypothetical protein